MKLCEIHEHLIISKFDNLTDYKFDIVINESILTEGQIIDAIKSKIPDYIKDAKKVMQNLANRPDVLTNTTNALLIKLQKVIEQIRFDNVKQKIQQAVSKLGLTARGALDKMKPTEAIKNISLSVLLIPIIKSFVSAISNIKDTVKTQLVDNTIDTLMNIAGKYAPSLVDFAGSAGVTSAVVKGAANSAKEIHSAHKTATQHGPFGLKQNVTA